MLQFELQMSHRYTNRLSYSGISTGAGGPTNGNNALSLHIKILKQSHKTYDGGELDAVFIDDILQWPECHWKRECIAGTQRHRLRVQCRKHS